MHLLKKKKKIYHLISREKYSVTLLQEELEKFNVVSLIYHFNDSTKSVDHNYLVHTETLFDDINSKEIRFEDIEKNQMEFESKYTGAIIGDNKSDKQVSKIENILNFCKLQEEVIMIILKWYLNLPMIQNMERFPKP